MSTDASMDSLTIKASGPAAEAGTIPLAEIARIAGGFQASLDRLALAMRGRSLGPGRRPSEIVEAVQLSLVGLERGSVCLKLARSGQEPLFTEHDVLFDTIRTLSHGIHTIRRDPLAAMPEYFSPALINGLRDLAGGISPGKLSRIELRDHEDTVLLTIDQQFRDAVKGYGQERTTVPVTVVGRLHMGDFSPASLRCRVDTFAGSILCDFDLGLKDEILNAMDSMVMVSGPAEMQPDGATVRLIHLTEIEVIETVRTRTLEELAAEQNIGPAIRSRRACGRPDY